ncbi:MAG: hypothetical protein KQJ78_07735 [Deltaproteobacteria bacterium]|nr:hypothetical protein [Deltaproteobacteria bacterium]
MMFDAFKPTFHGRDLVSKLSAFMDFLAGVLGASADPSKFQIGSRAERVAYATPFTGLMWSETDYPAIWRYTGSAWQYAGGAEALGGRKNLLINGDFAVTTRGTSFTSATTPANNDDTFTLDRWLLLSDGNNIVNLGTASGNYSGHTGYVVGTQVAANEQWGLGQVLEYQDARRIIGQAASLTFHALRRAANVTAGTVRAAVLYWTGTADSVTSDLVAAWAGNGTEPTWAANWTRAGITDPIALTTAMTRYTLENISIPITAKNVAVFIWLDDTNATAADILDFTGFQLERGAEATSIEHRPYAQELALCQRYYWALKEAGFNNPSAMAMGIQGSTTALRFPIIFPVPMRVAPTAALTIGGLTVFAAGGSTAITGLSGALAGRAGAQIDLAHAAIGTAGNPAYLRGTGTTGQITFSAEL